MTERRVLDNWKEIASYLGRTGKTCRNWEKEYGLPVHRLDGSPRAHVFAYPDEIDRWKEDLLREEKSAAEISRGYKRGSSADLESREVVKFGLKKFFVPAAIGLVVLAAALAVVIKSRGPHYDPKRIIVARFENQTGDKSLEPMGRIVADWITQGVSRAGIAEIVEAPPGESAPGTPKETERIRALAREAEAGTLLSGAYFLQGKSLSFHARVSNMSNGKLIKALDPIIAPIEDPIKAIEFLRQKVLGALAEIADQKMMPGINISGQPPTYEAYKEYTAGQDAFIRGDWTRAIDLFLRAAALDPNFKRPFLYASTAYINLGQYAAGEKLIDELEKVREILSPWDRIAFDYKKAFFQGDLAGRLRTSRQLASRIRGIYLYQWGKCAMEYNRPREAVKALSMIDPEGIWMKDWPFYWIIKTQTYHMLGRYREELKQAGRGRRQFPENMVIFGSELRALAALGRIEEIDRVADQSLNMKSDKIYNPGWLMNAAGQELRVHGFPKGSLQMFDRAVEWLQARPDEEKASKICRHQLAHAYYGVGRWPAARILAEDLLKEDPENVSYLGMCGALAANRGDREEALKISKKLDEIKRPFLWGSTSYYRACIASLLGEKETAVRLLREAISQGTVSWKLYEDMDLDPLRDYPPFKELIKPKG